MREAELELEILALGHYTVTSTGDFELLGVALGDTNDHVVDQGAGQAVLAAGFALVIRTLDLDGVLFLRNSQHRRNGVGELALRALHEYLLAVDLDLDARGNGDRKTSDT